LSGKSNGGGGGGNHQGHYYVGKEEQRKPLNGILENGNATANGTNRSSGGSANGFMANILNGGGGAKRKNGSNSGNEWTMAMGGDGDGGPISPSSNKVIVGLLAAQTIAKARQNAKRQAALILAAYLTFWWVIFADRNYIDFLFHLAKKKH
jgi:hypothetical protein